MGRIGTCGISKTKLFTLMTILAFGVNTQSFEFDFNLDSSKIHDFQYMKNSLVYINDKNLVAKDIRNGKIMEQYKMDGKFDNLHMQQDMPYVWVSGLGSIIYRYSLIEMGKFANKKGFYLSPNKHPKKLVSKNGLMILAFEKEFRKMDLKTGHLHRQGLKFTKSESSFKDFTITNDGKYCIAASQSSSELLVIDTVSWKVLGSGFHNLDHSIKITNFGLENVLAYDSHGNVQYCKLAHTNVKAEHSSQTVRMLPVATGMTIECHTLNIKLPEEKVNNVGTHPRILHAVNSENSPYLILVSYNVNKIYVLNLKNQDLKYKSQVNIIQTVSIKAEHTQSSILKAHHVPKSNMIFILTQDPKTKTNSILGLNLASVYNCDACPMCTGDLKKDCLLCSQEGEVWIDGKCLKCLKTSSQSKEIQIQCQRARYFQFYDSRTMNNFYEQLTFFNFKDKFAQKKKVFSDRILSNGGKRFQSHRQLETEGNVVDLRGWNWLDVEFEREEEISVEMTREESMANSKKWKNFFAVEISSLGVGDWEWVALYRNSRLRIGIKLNHASVEVKNKSFVRSDIHIYLKNRNFKIGDAIVKTTVYAKKLMFKSTVDLVNFEHNASQRKFWQRVGLLLWYGSFLIFIVVIYFALVSLFKGFNLTLDAVSLLLMLKQFYYMKYINSDFGPLINSFFHEFHNPAELLFSLDNQMMRGKSRGKLDYSGLRKYTIEIIPDRLIIFMLLWIYSIYSSYKIHRFKSEITYSGNKHTELAYKKKIWNYLNIKAFALLFVVQDLVFHLSNDMFMSTNLTNDKSAFGEVVKDDIYFIVSLGFMLRLIFELYTKIAYPRRINFMKVDRFRLDTSLENLNVVSEIITEQELFENALNLNCQTGEEIKQNQKLRIWMTGVEKTMDETDYKLSLKMKKRRKNSEYRRGGRMSRSSTGVKVNEIDYGIGSGANVANLKKQKLKSYQTRETETQESHSSSGDDSIIHSPDYHETLANCYSFSKMNFQLVNICTNLFIIFLISGWQNFPTLQIALLLKIVSYQLYRHLKVNRQLMRYSLEEKSKTLELVSFIMFLILAVFFTKNEFFYQKSFRYNFVFQLLEMLTLVLWLLAFIFRIRHLFLKYIEILRRRDSPDDENLTPYGKFGQFHASTQSNILTLDNKTQNLEDELQNEKNNKLENEEQNLDTSMGFQQKDGLTHTPGNPIEKSGTPNYSIRSRKQVNQFTTRGRMMSGPSYGSDIPELDNSSLGLQEYDDEELDESFRLQKS